MPRLSRLCSLVATGLLTASAAAHADPVTYNIVITGTPYNGTGFFTLDSAPDAVGYTEYSGSQLLDFTISFAGNVYTRQEYRSSAIEFEDGIFDNLSGVRNVNNTGFDIFVGRAPQSEIFQYFVAGAVVENASLTVSPASAPAAVTPEPSSLLLLATGLLGGATTCVRRRRAGAPNPHRRLGDPMPLLPRTLAAAVLTCALAVLLPSHAKADTLYTYTGPHYGSTRGGYTANEFIAGTFDLAQPLGANLSFASVTPTSYTFNDGLQTFTQTSSYGSFAFSTDGSGAITGYRISLSGDPYGEHGMDVYDTPFGFQDSVEDGLANSAYTTTDAGPGTVALAPGTAVTPEPSSLLLLGTGLASLAGVARRRFLSHAQQA